MEGFSRSLAVLIAIDRYGNEVPQLKTPVSDANGLADILTKKHGFEAEVIANEAATLSGLRAFLSGLKDRVGGNDRVLFYFAGHGVAIAGSVGPEGFILPQDAYKDSTNSFLKMTELSDALSALPCRHMLAILDCCFAGALRWGSTRDLAIRPEELHRERYHWFIQDPAWQAIASAAHDQKALDVAAEQTLGKRDDQTEHSPFAKALMEGLSGAADRAAVGKTGDGVITATELYLYLEEALLPAPDSDRPRQTPLFWPMKKHDKGQFVFLVPGVKDPPKLPPAPPLDENANPWRGLKPYEKDDRDIFFGRKAAREALCLKLLGEEAIDKEAAIPSDRFLVVTGPSGIGKSSLVRAGVLPWLPDTIRPLVVRPGPTPFASLAAALAEASGAGASPDAHGLETDPNALARWVKAQGERKFLLVIDQAEELITMQKARPNESAEAASGIAPYLEKAQRIAIWLWDARRRARIAPSEPKTSEKTSAASDCFEAYLKLVANALDVCPNLQMVLTVRSEYEPQFAQSPLGGKRWNHARYLVPSMTQDELRRVIEGPAAVKVIRFEDEKLIDQLVNEVVQMPGALPVLSFALSEIYRLYLKRRSGDRVIAWADYEALQGGVTGSLRVRADEVIGGVDEAHRATARRVLERMVSVEGGEFARRRVPRSEFADEDAEENKRIDDILARLDEARLIVTDDAGGEPHVELAHDTLILGWMTLVSWVREDVPQIQVLRKLTSAANEWRANKTDVLWDKPAQLEPLEKLRENPFLGLNGVENAFALASIERARTIRRIRVAAMAALALLSIGLYQQRNQAQQERNQAQARQINAQIAMLRERDPNAIRERAALAIHSYKIFPTGDASQFLAEALRSLNHFTGRYKVEGELATVSEAGGYVVSWLRSENKLVIGAADPKGVRILWSASLPLIGRSGRVTSLAVSSDGQYASAIVEAQNATLLVFKRSVADSSMGHEIYRDEGNWLLKADLAFSPKSSYLIARQQFPIMAGGFVPTLYKLTETVTRVQLQLPEGFTYEGVLAISNNEKKLALLSKDTARSLSSQLLLFDLGNSNWTIFRGLLTRTPTSLAFNANDDGLVADDDEGYIVIKIGDAIHAESYHIPLNGLVNPTIFLIDRKRNALIGSSRLGTGSYSPFGGPLHKPFAIVEGSNSSPDGQISNKGAYFDDKSNEGDITSLGILTDEDAIITADVTNRLTFWEPNLRFGTERRNLPLPGLITVPSTGDRIVINDVEFNYIRSSGHFPTRDGPKGLRVWGLEGWLTPSPTNKLLYSTSSGLADAKSAISHDGEFAALLVDENATDESIGGRVIHVVSLRDGSIEKVLRLSREDDLGALKGLTFSDDSKALAASFDPGPTLVWRLEGDSPIAPAAKIGSRSGEVRFSHDTEWIVISAENKLAVWRDWKSGNPRPIGTVPITDEKWVPPSIIWSDDNLAPGTNAIAISADDKLLAAGTDDGKVVVIENWKSADPQVYWAQPIGRDPTSNDTVSIRSLAFHPAEPVLAVAVRGKVHVVDLNRKQELLRAPAPLAAGVAFSADGKFVTSGYAFWIWRPEDMIKDACSSFFLEKPNNQELSKLAGFALNKNVCE